MASGVTASSTLRVAVTQAEPVWLDLEGTVEKTCKLIVEAATNGATLIAFPECWLPGYPSFIWARSVDVTMTVEYIKNGLPVDSEQMARICQSAADNSIAVVLGFSENYCNSLYIAQAVIDTDGSMKLTRRKLKPTHMERTMFGDAGGECLDSVTDTKVARIGALSCWEHAQPLLKYHAYSQREQIHVSAWPPAREHGISGGLYSMAREGIQLLSQSYAIESQSFVLHTSAVITEKGIARMATEAALVHNTPGGGNSAIFAPDGRKISQDIPETEEGIIYANLNLDEIVIAKSFLDVCGHYSRPDLLWLGVDPEKKKHVR